MKESAKVSAAKLVVDVYGLNARRSPETAFTAERRSARIRVAAACQRGRAEEESGAERRGGGEAAVGIEAANKR